MSRTYAEDAWLYDAAFSWDVAEEVAWLRERLGAGARSLLEPGCGSGRMFPAFARHGLELTGVDSSPVMLERARERMRAEGLPPPRLVLADMAGFRLGARLGGAYCPINTFGYLLDEGQAAAHLRAVAEHLEPGARYLVQLDLEDLAGHVPRGPDEHSCWEVESPRGRIRASWFGVDWDPARRVETHVARFEILTGAEAGSVFEDRHRQRLWDWASWQALLDASPFEIVRAYDASRSGSRPPVEPGPGLEGLRLAWHELRRREPGR